MTDSLKLHSVRPDGEHYTHPMVVAECMQDELCSDVSGGEMSFSERALNSNEVANAQGLHHPYLVQGLRSTRSSPTIDLHSSSIIPTGWDSCRRPPSFHSNSAISLRSHADNLSFVRNLASQSTVTYTNDSLARSTIDHLPFSHVNQSLESIPCSSFSILARQAEHTVRRTRRLPSTTGAEDSFTSSSESVNHHLYPHSSHLPALSTHLDHLPNSDQDRTRHLTRESVSTPYASSEHWVPIPFHSNGTASDPNSLSDPECYSGSGYALRRARRRLHAHETQLTQASPTTEESTRIRARTYSSSPTVLHSRRSPGISRVSSPPVLGDGFFLPEPEDCDNLPALLSPSDSSESDSLPSSDSSSRDTDGDSQILSDDGRSSRFLNPGTPIQTQLPELHTLLELNPTQDGGDPSRLWVASEGSIAIPDQMDIQMSGDEDDFIGDMDRAKELLGGLEQVNAVLVRRYEKVRGDGDDICTVCRDVLLPPENSKDTDDSGTFPDPSATWGDDILMNTPRPSNPPTYHEEPAIHAFPCTHLFHTNCLLPWLSLKTTCPTCRLDIDPHSLTLRVREWGSSSSGLSTWPYVAGVGAEQRQQRAQYVNVDALGRRIPWRRPCVASLEEWVKRRENETPAQRAERLKLCPSPCGGFEPPPGDGDVGEQEESTLKARRRTVSEPPATTDTCQEVHTSTNTTTSLGPVICESSELELRGLAMGRVGLPRRSRSLSGMPRENEELGRTTTRARSGDYGSPSPTVRDLEGPLYRGSHVWSPNAIQHTTVSTGISLWSGMATPERISGLAFVSGAQDASFHPRG